MPCSFKITDKSLLTTLKEPKTTAEAKVNIINIISRFQNKWKRQLIHLHSHTNIINIDNNINNVKAPMPPKVAIEI